MTTALYAVGFNRTGALTATTVLLPVNGTVAPGTEFVMRISPIISISTR